MNTLKAKCPRCRFEYKIPLNQELIRTMPQNSLYWSVYVKTIADHLGYFPSDLHEELKLLFNPKDSKLVFGARVGGTTTRMNRKEFSEYLEKIKAWAMTEYQIVLPEPEPQEAVCK